MEKQLFNIEKREAELSFLVKFRILPKEDVKLLLDQTRKFEDKLVGNLSSKKLVYLEYIRNQAKFQKFLVQYRRDEGRLSRIAIGKRNQLIEHLTLLIRIMNNHISKLFRRLVTKYQFDSDVWLAYIDYAKEQGWNHRVSALYWRLLRVKNEPEYWVQAAEYERSTNKAYETARALYLTALRHHPGNFKIWLSYFEMEVKFRSLIDKRRRILYNDKPVDVWQAEPPSLEEFFKEAELASKVYQAACSKLVDKADLAMFTKEALNIITQAQVDNI